MVTCWTQLSYLLLNDTFDDDALSVGGAEGVRLVDRRGRRDWGRDRFDGFNDFNDSVMLPARVGELESPESFGSEAVLVVSTHLSSIAPDNSDSTSSGISNLKSSRIASLCSSLPLREILTGDLLLLVKTTDAPFFTFLFAFRAERLNLFVERFEAFEETGERGRRFDTDDLGRSKSEERRVSEERVPRERSEATEAIKRIYSKV